MDARVRSWERSVGELGLPAYRGRQLYRWIYARSATDFDSMTDLPRAVRAELAKHYSVRPPRVAGRHRSQDGTVKFLFGLEDDNKVEAVYIPDHPEDTSPNGLSAIPFVFPLKWAVP